MSLFQSVFNPSSSTSYVFLPGNTGPTGSSGGGGTIGSTGARGVTGPTGPSPTGSISVSSLTVNGVSNLNGDVNVQTNLAGTVGDLIISCAPGGAINLVSDTIINAQFAVNGTSQFGDVGLNDCVVFGNFQSLGNMQVLGQLSATGAVTTSDLYVNSYANLPTTDIQGNTNSAFMGSVRNFNAGSSAQSVLQMGNDTRADAFLLSVNSSGNSTSAPTGATQLLANSGDLYLTTNNRCVVSNDLVINGLLTAFRYNPNYQTITGPITVALNDAVSGLDYICVGDSITFNITSTLVGATYTFYQYVPSSKTVTINLMTGAFNGYTVSKAGAIAQSTGTSLISTNSSTQKGQHVTIRNLGGSGFAILDDIGFT